MPRRRPTASGESRDFCIEQPPALPLTGRVKAPLLTLLAIFLWGGSAAWTAEPGVVSTEARALVQTAVKAAGGEDKLPDYFMFKDRVLLGETDTGFGTKRESVVDAPGHWWLKAASGYKERSGEPANFLVWAWTLRALTDAASTIEVIPDVKDGGAELWGLRVSGSVTPAMDLYFTRTENLLARIDWRSDIHRFSDWRSTAGGFKYPARVVGHKKATGKIWYFDEVLEVTPLKELPEQLREKPVSGK
jgi:hypothetical protein